MIAYARLSFFLRIDRELLVLVISKQFLNNCLNKVKNFGSMINRISMGIHQGFCMRKLLIRFHSFCGILSNG
jgi:hypothetical protein